MSAPGEVVTQARPSKAWLVSCAALCLAIVAYGVLGAKETSGNIAYLLGYNLPIALLLAGALYVVFCRRESGRTSWLGFFFIYTALITASIIASNRQRTELRTAVTEIERAVAAAAPSGTA